MTSWEGKIGAQAFGHCARKMPEARRLWMDPNSAFPLMTVPLKVPPTLFPTDIRILFSRERHHERMLCEQPAHPNLHRVPCRGSNSSRQEGSRLVMAAWLQVTDASSSLPRQRGQFVMTRQGFPERWVVTRPGEGTRSDQGNPPNPLLAAPSNT